MNCPDCGAANPADARFCGDCGQRIEELQIDEQRIDQPRQAAPQGGASAVSWDDLFKWIGIGVVGLLVLGLLAGF